MASLAIQLRPVVQRRALGKKQRDFPVHNATDIHFIEISRAEWDRHALVYTVRMRQVRFRRSVERQNHSYLLAPSGQSEREGADDVGQSPRLRIWRRFGGDH